MTVRLVVALTAFTLAAYGQKLHSSVGPIQPSNSSELPFDQSTQSDRQCESSPGVGLHAKLGLEAKHRSRKPCNGTSGSTPSFESTGSSSSSESTQSFDSSTGSPIAFESTQSPVRGKRESGPKHHKKCNGTRHPEDSTPSFESSTGFPQENSSRIFSESTENSPVESTPSVRGKRESNHRHIKKCNGTRQPENSTQSFESTNLPQESSPIASESTPSSIREKREFDSSRGKKCGCGRSRRPHHTGPTRVASEQTTVLPEDTTQVLAG